MKKFTGIAQKLTFGVIVFGILLSSVCGALGYNEFSAILKRQYNDTAYEIANAAREILNPDKFDEYLSTGKTDEEYSDILNKLNILAKKTNANFIYVVKVVFNSDGTLDYTYIYETKPLTFDLEPYPMGYTQYGLKKAYADGVADIMKNGGEKMEYYSDTEATGYHTTVAVAVKDSEGTPVAMLCVEKPMTRLEEAGQTYLKAVLAGTAVTAAVFSAVYVMFLLKIIINPVLTTANEVRRFALDSIPSDALLSVKRNDEIGVLERAIGKMEKDIADYMENLASVTAERERVNTELEVAARIQASMLPSEFTGVFSEFPDLNGIDISALMCPAKEVGGDFYDFFPVDGSHIAVVAADVSGKGVPAALFMAIGKTLIKDRTMSGKALDSVFGEVNDLLCGSNSEGLFITAFEGVLDLDSGEFLYVNAGHETPFIRGKNGVFKPHRIASGFVLAGMDGIKYKCGSIQLEAGDMLFQYTDGVTEASNVNNELYGEERLEAALNRNASLPPKELLLKLKEDIDAFAGNASQFDDITMICFEYKVNTAAKQSAQRNENIQPADT